jgi:chemosensory pili system protein ChpA (sensor histidine kinase/response regulator)
MNAVTEFDVGPLTWVKSEIDLALERADQALQQYTASASDGAGDLTHIKFCRTHLHQVQGALTIVGLDGVTQFSEAMESLLEAIEQNRRPADEACIALAQRALAAIRHYLDDLISGQPNQPLRLLPIYREVQTARGQGRVSATDLFFPDLTIKPPRRDTAVQAMDRSAFQRLLRQERARFQRGLLSWLRAPQDRSGISEMLNAVKRIEATQDMASARAFWWVATGFLAALAEGTLPAETDIKQLCARIDLQIRRLFEGSKNVAERLMRDALYFVASADSSSGAVQLVKSAYQLQAIMPSADAGTPAPQEAVRRRLREVITATEETWNKFCAGTAQALPLFKEHATALSATVEQLGQTDYRRLAQAIATAARWLTEKPSRHSESLAMEIATAILLTQNAQENFQRLGSDFAHQVDVMVERIHGCIAENPPMPGSEVPELDEMSRQAQEKLLIAQVAKEIQTNLAQIEQVLDGFFRDVEKRADLSTLEVPLRQVIGALTMMRHDGAVTALRQCAADIKGFTADDYLPQESDFERVADELSILGFFIDSIQHGTTDFESFVRSIQSGPDDQSGREEEPTETVEQEVEQQKRETHALFEALKQQPSDAGLREELKQNLSALQKDADLVADKELGQQTKAALSALEAGSESAPQMDQAIASLKLHATEAPLPSAATLHLSQSSVEEIDAELLAIFLEEAHEVLGAIDDNFKRLNNEPHNTEVLTDLRRSFHTLKGSGRMVGLKDLGEVAWSVEQVLNLWLRQEVEVNEQLFDLLGQAHEVFSAWVAHLESGSGTAPDVHKLVALAELLKRGDDELLEAALPGVAPAPASIDKVIEPQVTPVEAVELASPEDSLEAAEISSLKEAGDFVFDLPLEPTNVLPDDAFTIADIELAAGEEAVERPFEPEAQSIAQNIEMPALEMPALEMPIDISANLAHDDASNASVDEIPEFDFELPAESADSTDIAAPIDIIAKEVPPVTPTEAPVEMAEIDFETSQDSYAPLDDIGEMDFELSPPEKQPAVIGESEAVEETPVELVNEFACETAPPIERFTDSRILITPTLNDIFLEEARVHLATLQHEFSLLENDIEAPTPHEMYRAAHTLAGTAATVGQIQINRLGLSFEHALLRRDHASHPGSLEALIVIRQTIAELELMLSTVAEARSPEASPRLIDALDSLYPTALTESSAASPASEEIPPEVEPAKVAAAAAFTVETPQLQDELDEQLLPIFLEEAVDLNEGITTQLRAWRANPSDSEISRTLARLLHTMKGSARMVGAMNLGEITHAIETRIEDAHRTGVAPLELIDEIDSAYDAVIQIVERLQHGETLELPETEPGAVAATGEIADSLVAPATHKVSVAPVVNRRDDSRLSADSEAAEADPGAQRAMLRVRADLIDRLVNEAGELSIARARIEGEMRGLKDSLLDLTENVIRLRRQLRDIEIQAESQMQSRTAVADERHAGFDPLEIDRFTRFQELTRMMAESVNDVATVQQNLFKNLDDANAAILAQARLNREVQQELMSVRMVPFGSVSDRLYRIVRQTGKELGKRANLEIRGGHVEIDRSVLDKMGAPLEHLLRNAIAHGLENRDARLAANKEEIGEIGLTLVQEGNEIILTFSDDGAGLDFERIRARGIASGLLQPEAEASNDQLVDLIFSPGFSTASEISQVSGRGIGMDVVKTEVTGLGGRIEVVSTPGQGTSFRLYIPLTLAVTQAVLVRTGSRIYAIPSVMIEQVLDLKDAALARIREAGAAEWMGNHYPFNFLPHLLGETQALPEMHRQYWVLLLRSGSHRIAVQVDELKGNQEVVVKNIGPQLARVIGIDGATVLGNGQVVLILNPVALTSHAPSIAFASPIPTLQAPAATSDNAATLPTVMVVDDSLTVRKITGRLLSREGYEVLTAKDGVDALEQLLDTVPDVLIVDIEMPRMDGFDFTRNVRADARLKGIPIIMITSRTADKHRNYAMEIGVNQYLGKPYQEEELLALVADYVKQQRQS